MSREWSIVARGAISVADETTSSHRGQVGLERHRGRAERRRAALMNVAPDWGQLALDIRLASRICAPVLISAPSDCAENVARAIAAFSCVRHGPGVVVCDCAQGGSVTRAVEDARGAVGSADVTLVLREVHALGAAGQREAACLIAALPPDAAAAPRIIATSSVSLFDRVRDGTFDERLFYRLNVVHIVINGMEDVPRD